MKISPPAQRAFTLVELLVVVALIAALAAFLIGGFRDNKAVSLQTAQSALANLVTGARTIATTTGRSTRILVHVDASSTLTPARYLRYLVLQSHDGSDWNMVSDVFLPSSIYVVPREPNSVDGLIPVGMPWIRPSDGAALRSTALAHTAPLAAAVESAVIETWSTITFSARGTTADAGDVILAAGHQQKGRVSPVAFDDPRAVRGLSLSNYGVTALVNGQSGF